MVEGIEEELERAKQRERELLKENENLRSLCNDMATRCVLHGVGVPEAFKKQPAYLNALARNQLTDDLAINAFSDCAGGKRNASVQAGVPEKAKRELASRHGHVRSHQTAESPVERALSVRLPPLNKRVQH